MKKSIIYLARCNIDTSKVYVGKTDHDLEVRKKQHIEKAIRGPKTPFHQDLVRKGTDNWTFEIIDECPAEEVYEREKSWIKRYNADSIDILNVTHAREKAKKRKVFSKEQKARQQLGGKGAKGVIKQKGSNLPLTAC